MNMGKLWIEVLGKYRDIIPEFDRFIDIHLKPRVRVIRVNRLRIDPDRLARRLSRYNIRLEKVGWFDTAFIVREGVDKIGRTLEYHLGLYYIMDLVSLIPILIINRFRPRMVLDISAAPGGKALALAENMVGEGIVIANDPDRVRLKALIANIDRMGYPNIIVTSIDGRRYPRIRGVDCVLFDAPCSNESHITSIPEDDLSRMYLSGSVYRAYSRLQADILKRIYEITCEGTKVVYTVCTYNPLESEGIVADAMDIGYKILDESISIPLRHTPGLRNWGDRVYPKGVDSTMRIYPHLNYVDGYIGYLYIAVLER